MPATIGEKLKAQRLDRKLSLEDAAKSILVRIKYLEALEDDDFDLLPSSVQGRGFLRSYAEFLNLDPEPLLKAWEQKTVVDEMQVQQPDLTQNDHLEQSDDKSKKTDEEVLENKPKNLGEASHAVITSSTPQSIIDTPPSARSANSLDYSETSQSTIHFMEVSDTLRKQREILGLSLGDIEQYTHIRQFYLQAIEECRFQDLPSPVQAKGMIENYAQFLDINSNELMLSYAEGLQAQREEKLAVKTSAPSQNKSVRQVTKSTLSSKLLTPDLIIGSVVILFLVVFAIWTTSRVISSRNLDAQATIPGISDVLAATTSPIPGTIDSATDGATDAATILSTPNLETPSPATIAEETIPGEVSTGAATETTSTAVFQDDAPLQVYIVTKQRTYMKVVVDGKSVFEGRTQPGNAYPYSGTKSIELLSGNAAALQIIFNDVDLGTIGIFGEVVDLIFQGGLVVTPTPRFTASFTSTTLPTMTLQSTATPVTPTVTPFLP